MNRRQGFTLIELLVATTVFTFGFTAAFGMFLAALRYRTLADDSIKLSLAASSLPEEIAIGTTVVKPAKPKDFDGQGALTTVAPVDDELVPYAAIPGTWYRVENSADLLLDPNNAKATTIHATILVVAYSQAQGDKLPLYEIWNRLRPRDKDLPGTTGLAYTTRKTSKLNPQEEAAFTEMLLRRGLAIRRSVVLVRRPSWMT